MPTWRDADQELAQRRPMGWADEAVRGPLVAVEQARAPELGLEPWAPRLRPKLKR